MTRRGDLRAWARERLDRDLIERAGACLAETRATAPPAQPEAAAPAPGPSARLAEDVWRIAAKALRMPPDELDPRENLANLGIDSIAITEVMVQISRHFGLSVAPTVFFEARHLEDLAAILFDRHGKAIAARYAEKEVSADAASRPLPAVAPTVPTPASPSVPQSWIARHRRSARTARPAPVTPQAGGEAVATAGPVHALAAVAPDNAPIAIISMEGRFPQSPDLEAFAAHLRDGDDCIEEVPPSRWGWQAVHGDPKKGAFTDVRFGGFVPDADRFDAGFFNISPREAELIDPQHRLFMECVFGLIEKGGYAPGALAGRKISVFLGINLLDYTDMINRAGIMEALQLTGLGHAFCPNRLSFLLDIHGPSEVVDTACSSSLVAIHRAVMSIRHEGCEMAIAGGSNLMLSPTQHIMFSKVGMITPDGRCKSFSAAADGYARADGVGAVLLKRLDLAERDGDPILGVIRGSVAHHGGGATSLTAPNPKSQARLIVEAHRQAGVDPRSIGLIECHGTGTPLGDPVEIEGLKLAFAELHRDWQLDPPTAPTIGIGSVKSNIGHAETAAGVAGLIKILLAMRETTLYRTLHCAEPNPLLDLAGTPFHLLTQAAPWKRPVVDGAEQPLRAGLSSFGAGGANVHLVIEEYRPTTVARPAPPPGPHLFPVSAKSEAALRDGVARLRAAAGTADLPDMAATLQVGRDAMRVRVCFAAADRAELLGAMDAFLTTAPGCATIGILPAGRRPAGDALDPRGSDPATVAAHWTAGGAIDWQALHAERPRRRIALPPYAFQRSRYWLTPEASKAATPALLRPDPMGDDRYALVLTGQETFLADHRVAGSPVLPGVAYLELAREAAVQAGHERPSLRQVVWTAPLRVDRPVTVICEILPGEDGRGRVEIYSTAETGERTVHAQMRIALAGEPVRRTVDLAALRGAPARHRTPSDIYATFDAIGLVYGPAHRVIVDLAIIKTGEGSDAVLAELALPEALRTTMNDFTLHPSLVDGALQSAIGLAQAGGGTALPFSIAGVEILGPCEARMWAHVRASDAQSPGAQAMDVDLVAADGSVRVAITGFVTRQSLAATPAMAAELLPFEPRWVPLTASDAPPMFGRRVVLLADGITSAEGLEAALPGTACVLLDAGTALPLAQRFKHLATQFLSHAQTILAERGDAPLLLQMVVESGCPPLLSGLAGMMRSLCREQRQVHGQVCGSDPGGDMPALAAGLREAEHAPAGALLRAAPSGVSIEAWEEAAIVAAPPGWRQDGVTLITGGSGGLGQILARDILAAAPRATVILASRHAPAGGLAILLRDNPTLHHVTADLSDPVSVARLVDQVRHDQGGLDGVIHAAGTRDDGAFRDKSAAQLGAVLAPKVTGVLALDGAIGTAPLDFFLLFSSISAVTGNAGQADYAAANGFLDGFAEAREARRQRGECHGRTLSIAWPLWREGGMRLDEAQEALMHRVTGMVPLGTAAGLGALHAALAGDAPRRMIAAGDPARIRRFVGALRPAEEGAPVAETKDGREAGVPAAGAPDPRDLYRPILAALLVEAGTQLKVAVSDLEADVELTEYGFDSMGFTQFANRLNDRFCLELTPTLFFEHPTLEGLATCLSRNAGGAMMKALGLAPRPAAPNAMAPASAQAAPPPAPVGLQASPRLSEASDTAPDAVAIIGMSGQFPGAPNVDALWQALSEGRDCIGEVPPERWDWRDYAGDPHSGPGRGNARWGGFIDGMAAFDAAFFGISAPEARMMDPQQRLLLTEAWRVIEDAGYAPSSLAGSRTGVFIGTADTGYSRLVADAGTTIEAYTMTGLAPSLGPNRVSYHLDFHGPSVAVETACSSALVAVHRAIEAIRSGHCTAAIAGGVNALLLPEAFVGFSRAGMLSPGGRCKPFSAAADGYARGEGIGLVLLKPLAVAEADGDRILAVIRASAENHGGRAASLTAPNPKAQADLLRAAYSVAGIDPRSVTYIEAHGTGTPLGDPIEVEALTAAFADLSRDAAATFGPAPAQSCAIGSIKSNIGHLELAAGAAGLIKVLLQLRHGTIAATLHCDELNPYLKLGGGPFHVARQQAPWIAPVDAGGRNLPRRAGVSSFGFGGSNAHLVLEEYRGPAAAPAQSVGDDGPSLVVLSARSAPQLKQMAERLLAFLAEPGRDIALADFVHMLQVAREPMAFRLGFPANDLAGVIERLSDFLEDRSPPDLHVGQVKTNRSLMAVLESDGPLRDAAAGLADRGRAEDLLALWAGGLNVDWSALRRGRSGRRIALPGYPFATTRHWVTQATAGASTFAAAIAAVVSGAGDRQDVVPPVAARAGGDPVASGIARLAHVLGRVTAIAARTLEVDAAALDGETELGDYGFDSLMMTSFASRLNDELGLSLTPADFFEFGTLKRLAEHVAGALPPDGPALAEPEAAPHSASAMRRDVEAIAGPARRPVAEAARPNDEDPIVIVGQSCSFPMARDADEFWDNLLAGRDCISPVPADRWSWQALDGDPKHEAGKTDIHWGGFIQGVFEFDPLFFGISPREARLMDPQQRLMLMHAWKAIEDAGHSPRSLAGQSVGVFVATASSGYRDGIDADPAGEGYLATGSVASVGPNRISYFLDLHGPSEPVETACSSSLVALHRAVQAIRGGDCTMALVGGVNTMVTPEGHIAFAKAGMLAPDGRCKTFSPDADGYGRGEGVGMILVRRLSDAERDGDPILAIVRGTGINHGGHAQSLTAPNTRAQADLLRSVYARAGVDPRSVGYVEAHGTGTALGDPVEINALKSAFRSLPERDEGIAGVGCAIGAVKTNIGHLELAAGMAGVIKVLKQIEHRQIAPSLHCEALNPFIDLGDSPFEIVRGQRPWMPARDASGAALPLRAGVSSFGFGGVNAHVILEEYRQPAPLPVAAAPGAQPPAIVVLSSRDGERLKESAQNLLAVLDSGRIGNADLHDLAHTLQVGRAAMAERLAVVAASVAALQAQLGHFLAGESAADLHFGRAHVNADALSPGAKPADIARHWAGGGTVDWRAIDPAPRRRLRLPTYPFARDIYRIDGDGASKAATRATATPAAEASFTDTRLEADAFYLRDHRVQGSRILPGAMSLELVRRAAAGVDGVGTATLSGLTWRRPLELNSGTIDVRVETTATRTASSGFRLVARDDPQSDYVRGTVAATTPAEAPQTIDLESSKAACRRVHDPDWLYAAYAALGIAYGPSFRSVVGLWSGNGQVLAQLRLPTAEASGCYLHPAMLDAAFQAAMALFVDDDDAQLALPFGIERMEVYAPTTGAMWAHLRTVPSGAAIRKLDIDLADESGRLCVRIEGFSLRRLATLPEGRTLPGVAPETATPGRDVAETYFVGLVAHASGMDAAAISVSAPLEEYGIDSIMITRLTDRLEEDFGQLSRTLFFEHQTLGALIGHFRERHGARLASVAGAQPERVARSAPPQAASGSSRKISGSGEPIAIIGLAGRYPGARTLPEFWRNLAAGRDSVTEIPADRWDHRRFFDPQRQAGKTTSRWGGFVDGHDRFDPLFFNIAPRDAQFIDPQERLFLQCAWETLEDAGYTRDSIAPGAAGGGDVGVFVGVMYQEYQLYGPERSAQGQPMALTGSAASIANRVSYFCNFQGPSLAVDSMCSSSLTAIHLACDSLRAGSCAVALAGGVNLTLHPNKYLALAQGRFLSSTGRCESFGEGGDGYVPAEGVGAVLLKPLRQAEADGDRIHGVILGSALNHGGKTNGYTVPNPAAQAAVIAAAMARAGVRPGEVSYVEAHGTGTSLGDPIEIAALSQAYGGERAGSVAIGSVKSNIGHGESAAGIAGLTKLLLQMRHSQFAPSLHAETLNPNIAWDETPFRVQRELQPWEREAGGLPRIAGLSSFGAGGSNAHVILAEYRHADEPAAEPRPDIYPLSARSPERLQAAAESLLAALNDLNAADLPAVAHVLQEGREAFEERLAIVAGNKDELAEKLGGVLSGRETAGTVRGRARRVAGEDGHAPGPEAMAEAWVRGVAIDWAARRTGLRPRPVSLPTYPFATEHCWLPDAADAAPLPTPAAASRLGLPLLFAPVWQERPRRSAVLPPETSRLVILCGVDDASFHDASRARSVDIVRLQASAGSIDERYAFYAARLMELLQRLARDRPAAAVVQVVVPATGRDAPLEGLAGMLRCVSLEHPTIACQLVAVETGVDGLPTRLAEDAAHAAGDRDIRHLAGRRLVRSWREATPGDAAIASPWKHGGSYLLTGGAGGIGLHVAGAIAAAGGHVALWLTGRSPLDPGIRQRLEALEAAGATARYRRVDLLDEAAMSALLREIELADGRLAGVFHGAGISRDGRFLGKDAATLRAVLAPKVAGTRILDAAIGDRPLDFMLLFASAAGAVGNPGQADYGAANGFLDAFATARNAEVARGLRQGRTIAVDWPYWRDGGMQMPDRAIAAMAREVGARPLETGPALAALAAVLAMPDEQLLVLDGDHDRLRRLMRLADVAPPPAEAASAAPVVAGTVADPAGAADRRALVATILSCFSAVLGIAESRLSLDDTIDRFGVDSVSATQIVEAMEARLGPLPQTLLFEFPTIGRLADELLARQAAAVATTQELIVNANTPAVEGLPAGAFQDQEAASSRDIAIIAVAGRYPGADTIEAFGAALRAGRDGITEIPPDRTELLPRFSERKGEPGASYCRWGGFLSDVDRFDAAFFGYSPRAAALADPQERLFLQTAWHLLERAGHTRAHLAHHYEARVGVFVGAMYNQYPALAVDSDSRAMLALSSYSGIANRTSFFFDLQGPSIAVDSMCSAGLQAVHLACQSLRAGECRLAIAGGVNLSIHPAKYEALSRGGLVGSDAGSRPFSGGDGYLPAEGVGAVLLKPLRDARRDGERILGVIKGSLANHSGHSAGYAVPSVDAQVRLLDGAFRRAGIDKATIGYVEAAANGSSLGDAIELRALTRVFAEAAPASIALGSVKANIGHAEAASGLAQLTKVLLQFDQKSLFPSPGLGSASAADAFHGTPFTPQTELLPWAAPVTGGEPQPRRATVSAFGAGGSNVHLILEEGPIPPDSIAEALGPRLFPVSARTDAHLAELRLLLADHLAATPGLSMGALSRTLIEGREAFDCRIDIVATDQVELARKLADQGHRESPETLATAFVEEAALPAMLVLPGYPFARERHWLPGAAPEQAGAGASAALPPPAASPPAAEPGETPLRLISRTLAAELGLAIEAIQPDDRFDALGVDSMIRMRLIYAVEATSGLIVDHRTLATHQTPRALAAFVEGEELPLPVATVPRAPDRGNGRAFACPLGESQKGLWVLQRLVPERGDYNVPLAFTVRSVDASALDAALAWLTQEHPLLACRIVDDGKDVALAARSDAVRVRAVAMPKEVEAAEFLRQRVLAPFDLGQGVFRAEHVSGGRLAMGESVVLLVAHHIVTDGLSSALIAQRFWAAYDHFATGAALPEPELGADYADFVAWETAFAASAEGQAQKAYWLDRLAGPLPQLRLPSQAIACPQATADGRVLECRLPPAMTERLREAAARLGCGAAAFYLGAFATLLYRYTGETDLVVGVPTLRRPSRRFASTVGYCANMIALRLALDPARPFADLAASVQGALAEGLDNADYPFAAIARERGGTATGEPPYQVTFAYQNFGSEAGDMSPFARGGVSHMAHIRQIGDTALGLEVQDDASGALLVVTYDGNRFSDGIVEAMVAHLRRILEVAIAPVAPAPSVLPMLTPPEINRSLHHWSRSGALPAAAPPIHEQIFAQAERTPAAIAMAAGPTRLSYRQLVARVRQIARLLRRQGVGPGDAVAVLLPREPDMVAALVAVMSIGAVWVPVDPTYPDARVLIILRDIGAVLVLCRGSTAERVRELEGEPFPVVDLDRARPGLLERFARPVAVTVGPSDPAYVIYTSGSTGTPKGVVVSHGALSEHCQVIARQYELTAGDGVLQFASSAVDTAIEQILPTLAAGARLVLRPDQLPTSESFRAFLAEAQVTVADLPPVYLQELLASWERSGADLEALKLRLLIVGGETLAPEVVALWARGPLARRRLLNAYGPTEATVTALVHEVRAGEQLIPIGRPLPGTEIYILDPDGNMVPDGIVGELHIGGRRLAAGYHGRADLTDRAFRVHRLGDRSVRLYRTGDLACFRPRSGGVVEFHGRADAQVKVRGFRVELGEIEAAIGGASGCQEVAVLAERSLSGDASLTAYVGACASDFDEPGVRQLLSQRLPAHMVPSVIVRLDRLPTTTSGKIDRAALRNVARPDVASAAPRAPRDALEMQIMAIWIDVLGLDPQAAAIGIDDDFASVGGNSLLAVRLLGRLENALGSAVSVADLAHACTIADQARLLRQRGYRERARAPVDVEAPPSLSARAPQIVLLQHPTDGGYDAKTPLFLIHAIAGTLTCYQTLVAELNTTRPVYGIRAVGLESGEACDGRSIEDLAASYCDQIRAVQPRGPYRLCGWSFGGVVAYEMARQLQQAGEAVAFLGLIDSYTPDELAGPTGSAGDDGVGLRARNFLRDLFGIGVAPAPGQDVVDFVMGLPQLSMVLPGASADDIRRLFAVFCVHYEAFAAYRPGTSDTSITLVRCEGTSGGIGGWRGVARSLTLHRVAGDHYGVLVGSGLAEWLPILRAALDGRDD